MGLPNSSPRGHLLLDKKYLAYNEQLDFLSQIQEIVDDFILEDTKSITINNQIALIYTSDDGEMPSIVKHFGKDLESDFEVFYLDIAKIASVNGGFGNFTAKMENEENISFAQAVVFVYEENLLRFRGIYSVADFDNPQSLMVYLKENLGIYSYKEVISFKNEICQYYHRRDKHCSKCAQICPTFGVGANDSLMELVFSPIDCTACGLCVGVCPTGALEYEEIPKEGLEEIIDLYEDKVIFLCDYQGYENLIRQNFILPSSLTPLVLPNLTFLNENDLMSMLQTSGNEILIFMQDLENQWIESVVDFVKSITMQIYTKNAIYYTDNVEEIYQRATEIQSFEKYLYKNRYNKPHRESFAQRLQYMIKDKDFGIAKSIAPVFYGNIKVDSTRCTLCLSCVGACNVNAIFAKEDDFSLRFNPSICTTCGYCVTSCPENVMDLSRDGLELNREYFKSKELAKDEPFKCVECGKVFSTKKSIDKVFAILSSAFASDEKKLKTLQCCPDCKVKVMFGGL
ncbi:4Fe-4S binding protein [Helicobacter apodemus]|uniref:Ferredoxin n=1 Tax=Helicobacter apodemus TaxID=135569 RepID=A0A2U8FE51_9HELI|nr:4Fe-4S binding protein [Helicobacter apodemus]AWI33685.1 ferredoxin [Helicobacter apodemus]